VTTARIERFRRLVPEPASPGQAALAVVGAILIVVALVAHAGGTPRAAAPAPPGQTTPQPAAAAPVAVSPARLRRLASSGGQPIYWVGPRAGVTYELRRAARGDTFLRYLPAGVPIGDRRAFLTVGTYPLANAFSATKALAKEPRVASKKVAGGGLAVYRLAKPTNVYVAYPRLDYQIEVFSASPVDARRLATSGDLHPVAVSRSAPTLEEGVPTAVSVVGLKALSASLGQPIYWVGPRAGTTYEITQKGTELFLRYLPAGVPLGTEQPEPTVGTYRVPNAFQTTGTAAGGQDAKRVDAGITGVGFYRPARPESVYLAFRGRDFQIEVYDPDPAKALRLATSGQVRPVE
jgi:hypothetical protein